MKTIYRNGSEITRVEFTKDATGKIGCFMLQDFGHKKVMIDSKWFKSEKAAQNWAIKILA